MNQVPSNKRTRGVSRFWGGLVAGAGAIALLFSTPTLDAVRAQEGWEWEPDEGYHEEEWYDPSDWFDDDRTVDYEFDWDDYGYGYTYNDFGYDVYDYEYDDDWYYTDDWYADEGLFDEWYR